MTTTTRRSRVPKARIAEYWLATDEGLARLPQNAASMDVGEPSCFACGAMATDAEEPPDLWTVWNRAWMLDRCHLIPRKLGGSDTPDNLVLLCQACHHDAPDVGDPQYMLDWIARREPQFIRWHKAMLEAIEAAGLTAAFHALTHEQVDRTLKLTLELQHDWVGTHGFHITDATVGALAVEVLRRILGAAPDGSEGDV
jgi:hypothetical protein